MKISISRKRLIVNAPVNAQTGLKPVSPAKNRFLHSSGYANSILIVHETGI
jgi:hypothetical protein